MQRNLHCDVVHFSTKWVDRLTLDCNGVFSLKAYKTLLLTDVDTDAAPSLHRRLLLVTAASSTGPPLPTVPYLVTYATSKNSVTDSDV